MSLKLVRSKSANSSAPKQLHNTVDEVVPSAGDCALPTPSKFVISEQLIKDQQKFLQRKKELHDRELAKQAEEEAYEKLVSLLLIQ